MVSVIIPNYNHSAFLRRRLDTVVNQTYQDIEVLILDDCSTDNSKKIIEEYSQHIKVVHIEINKTNSGSPFRQWEKGFKLVSGDFVWIAESDDFSELTFLELLMPKFENPAVKITFCRSAIVDENENIIAIDSWGKETSLENWNHSFVMNGLDFLENYQIYKNCIVNASSVVFRTSMVKNKIDIPFDLKRSGDWLFWNQMLCYGRVAFISEPLNYWRQHSTTTRELGNYQVEKEKFYEQVRVISLTKKALEKRIQIDEMRWNWLVYRWINRYSYRNLFRISYIFPPLPIKLLFLFYALIMQKTIKSIFQSIKKGFHYDS